MLDDRGPSSTCSLPPTTRLRRLSHCQTGCTAHIISYSRQRGSITVRAWPPGRCNGGPCEPAIPVTECRGRRSLAQAAPPVGHDRRRPLHLCPARHRHKQHNLPSPWWLCARSTPAPSPASTEVSGFRSPPLYPRKTHMVPIIMCRVIGARKALHAAGRGRSDDRAAT